MVIKKRAGYGLHMFRHQIAQSSVNACKYNALDLGNFFGGYIFIFVLIIRRFIYERSNF